MFEKSLHVKGRYRKRQTATRKLQEADNAHKRKLKKKKNPIIKIHEESRYDTAAIEQCRVL